MSHNIQVPAIPEQYAELWRQLKAYEFDKPGAINTFAGKLAKQNRWSKRFTLRVIEEYLRFLFIYAALGIDVSPSWAVDQVWHLHLQYTFAYWNTLCRGILQKELHHVPSDGTASDNAYCRDTYQEMMVHYRRFFGEPPADIWPTSGMTRWRMFGYCAQDAFYRVSESVVALWNHLGDTVGEAMRHAPYPYH